MILLRKLRTRGIIIVVFEDIMVGFCESIRNNLCRTVYILNDAVQDWYLQRIVFEK